MNAVLTFQDLSKYNDTSQRWADLKRMASSLKPDPRRGFEKKRTLSDACIEKQDSEDGFFALEGLASTFGNIDLDNDVIVQGAFSKTLSEHEKFPMLWQHSPFSPIGDFKAEEREDGLFISAEVLNTVAGTEIQGLVRKRVLKFSIGFIPKKVSFAELNGEDVRFIEEIDLKETSLVTFPANPEAVITGSKGSGIETIRDYEKTVRDVLGFSQREAKVLASKGFSALQAKRCDPDNESLEEIKDSLVNLENQIRGTDHGQERSYTFRT